MGKGNDVLNGKVEFWSAAMELHGQSGLSCVDFCNREGLAYSTFCRWRDKLSVVSAKGESPEADMEWRTRDRKCLYKADSTGRTGQFYPGILRQMQFEITLRMLIFSRFCIF